MVQNRRFGARRRNGRLDVRIFGAGRFRLFDIDDASGGSCQLPIRIRGTVNSSDVSQKPAYGKLKKLDISTYQYTAKAKYKGSDTFAIKATGQGPTASGTSVITVRATIK
jgi:hypothetical protein